MTTQKLELTWVGKNHKIRLEPRILIEDTEKSYGDPDTGNMLIHGDNLLALKALEQDYAGKVKCIYIDPPYNTGNAFEHYDDGLEHSEWLNLIKPRLEILQRLLSEDGIIFVQIDDKEQAYLKVLMDEIFGRSNFVNMLVVESGEVFGTKAAHLDKTFVKVKDYILVYHKNFQKKRKFKTLWTKTNEMFDSHYGNFINESLEKVPLVEYLSGIDWVKLLFEKYKLKLSLVNVAKVMSLEEKFKEYINVEISKYLFQDQPYSGELSDEENERLNMERIISINGKYVFKTASGSVRYYQPFSDAIHKTDDYISEIIRSTARGDLWKNYHTDMRNVDEEGGVKFKSSKKPERLIRDIFLTYTVEGDLILDSFLGSGTTIAVAQKMNRKWIGIEMGEHAYSHCKFRIDRVIDGLDAGGISGSINWQGGGGYKFYELGPSVMAKDERGRYVINPNMNGELLVRALCKIENFRYLPKGDGDIIKHGYSTERDFLHVTTRLIDQEAIDRIKSKYLKDDESILILAKTVADGLQLPPNIQVKKIPNEILRKCEYAKDDYSLPILTQTQEELEGLKKDIIQIDNQD